MTRDALAGRSVLCLRLAIDQTPISRSCPRLTNNIRQQAWLVKIVKSTRMERYWRQGGTLACCPFKVTQGCGNLCPWERHVQADATCQEEKVRRQSPRALAGDPAGRSRLGDGFVGSQNQTDGERLVRRSRNLATRRGDQPCLLLVFGRWQPQTTKSEDTK